MLIETLLEIIISTTVLIGTILLATIIGRILLPMVMVMVTLMVIPPTTLGGAPSDLEVMLKDFISKQIAFNKSVEEKLGKIDVLASKVDSLALDVELLKLKVLPHDVKESKTLNAIQVRIDNNVRMLAELHARWEREGEMARNMKACTITTTSDVVSNASNPLTLIGVEKIPTPCVKKTKTAETFSNKSAEIFRSMGDNSSTTFNDFDVDG
jgi:hypothetical protein